MKRESTK